MSVPAATTTKSSAAVWVKRMGVRRLVKFLKFCAL